MLPIAERFWPRFPSREGLGASSVCGPGGIVLEEHGKVVPPIWMPGADRLLECRFRIALATRESGQPGQRATRPTEPRRSCRGRCGAGRGAQRQEPEAS